MSWNTETDVLPLFERHVVVVVDEDPATLEALRRLLERESYELRLTARPEEALGWIAAGEVSLLVAAPSLLDRAPSRDVTRVMFTADAPAGWETSARELIGKPWNDRDLRKTLRLLLRERELLRG